MSLPPGQAEPLLSRWLYIQNCYADSSSPNHSINGILYRSSGYQSYDVFYGFLCDTGREKVKLLEGWIKSIAKQMVLSECPFCSLFPSRASSISEVQSALRWGPERGRCGSAVGAHRSSQAVPPAALWALRSAAETGAAVVPQESRHSRPPGAALDVGHGLRLSSRSADTAADWFLKHISLMVENNQGRRVRCGRCLCGTLGHARLWDEKRLWKLSGECRWLRDRASPGLRCCHASAKYTGKQTRYQRRSQLQSTGACMLSTFFHLPL